MLRILAIYLIITAAADVQLHNPRKRKVTWKIKAKVGGLGFQFVSKEPLILSLALPDEKLSEESPKQLVPRHLSKLRPDRIRRHVTDLLSEDTGPFSTLRKKRCHRPQRELQQFFRKDAIARHEDANQKLARSPDYSVLRPTSPQFASGILPMNYGTLQQNLENIKAQHEQLRSNLYSRASELYADQIAKLRQITFPGVNQQNPAVLYQRLRGRNKPLPLPPSPIPAHMGSPQSTSSQPTNTSPYIYPGGNVMVAKYKPTSVIRQELESAPYNRGKPESLTVREAFVRPNQSLEGLPSPAVSQDFQGDLSYDVNTVLPTALPQFYPEAIAETAFKPKMSPPNLPVRADGMNLKVLSLPHAQDTNVITRQPVLTFSMEDNSNLHHLNEMRRNVSKSSFHSAELAHAQDSNTFNGQTVLAFRIEDDSNVHHFNEIRKNISKSSFDSAEFAYLPQSHENPAHTSTKNVIALFASIPYKDYVHRDRAGITENIGRKLDSSETKGNKGNIPMPVIYKDASLQHGEAEMKRELLEEGSPQHYKDITERTNFREQQNFEMESARLENVEPGLSLALLRSPNTHEVEEPGTPGQEPFDLEENGHKAPSQKGWVSALYDTIEKSWKDSEKEQSSIHKIANESKVEEVSTSIIGIDGQDLITSLSQTEGFSNQAGKKDATESTSEYTDKSADPVLRYNKLNDEYYPNDVLGNSAAPYEIKQTQPIEHSLVNNNDIRIKALGENTLQLPYQKTEIRTTNTNGDISLLQSNETDIKVTTDKDIGIKLNKTHSLSSMTYSNNTLAIPGENDKVIFLNLFQNPLNISESSDVTPNTINTLFETSLSNISSATPLLTNEHTMLNDTETQNAPEKYLSTEESTNVPQQFNVEMPLLINEYFPTSGFSKSTGSNYSSHRQDELNHNMETSDINSKNQVESTVGDQLPTPVMWAFTNDLSYNDSDILKDNRGDDNVVPPYGHRLKLLRENIEKVFSTIVTNDTILSDSLETNTSSAENSTLRPVTSPENINVHSYNLSDFGEIVNPPEALRDLKRPQLPGMHLLEAKSVEAERIQKDVMARYQQVLSELKDKIEKRKETPGIISHLHKQQEEQINHAENKDSFSNTPENFAPMPDFILSENNVGINANPDRDAGNTWNPQETAGNVYAMNEDSAEQYADLAYSSEDGIKDNQQSYSGENYYDYSQGELETEPWNAWPSMMLPFLEEKSANSRKELMPKIETEENDKNFTAATTTNSVTDSPIERKNKTNDSKLNQNMNNKNVPKLNKYQGKANVPPQTKAPFFFKSPQLRELRRPQFMKGAMRGKGQRNNFPMGFPTNNGRMMFPPPVYYPSGQMAFLPQGAPYFGAAAEPNLSPGYIPFDHAPYLVRSEHLPFGFPVASGGCPCSKGTHLESSEIVEIPQLTNPEPPCACSRHSNSNLNQKKKVEDGITKLKSKLSKPEKLKSMEAVQSSHKGMEAAKSCSCGKSCSSDILGATKEESEEVNKYDLISHFIHWLKDGVHNPDGSLIENNL